MVKIRNLSLLLSTDVVAELLSNHIKVRQLETQLSTQGEQIAEIQLMLSQLKSRYAELVGRFISRRPSRVIEIGVWKGDRACAFLRNGPELVEYVGFDLFEDMTNELFEQEGMGNCTSQPLESVRDRLSAANNFGTEIRLIKGNTKSTLRQFIETTETKYDFILIDGGHSVGTIKSDWEHAKLLLSEGGVCILDDYYLDDDTVGCKSLVDSLNAQEWAKDFFRTVNQTSDTHYVTMVELSRKPRQD